MVIRLKTYPEHVCGYEVGYFIELDKNKHYYKVQQFQSGELVSEFKAVWFITEYF
jgi:hypothetical protein